MGEHAGEESARERRRRRRRREERRDTADAVGDTCELVDSVRGCGTGCSRLGRGRGGSDGCSCDGPCDLPLLRVSPLLLVAAAMVPARGASGLVRAALRGYQRWLSRFTPACPSTPSCSAYALSAVARHGARRGLRLAAARVRACSPGRGELAPDRYVAGDPTGHARNAVQRSRRVDGPPERAIVGRTAVESRRAAAARGPLGEDDQW